LAAWIDEIKTGGKPMVELGDIVTPRSAEASAHQREAPRTPRRASER
jgi:hypothetical protein